MPTRQCKGARANGAALTSSLQAAVKALEQLLRMGKTADGVAALLGDVPLPDDATVRDAGLPPVQGEVTSFPSVA